LAQHGDALAAQVLEAAGEALGVAVAHMARILNIDLYVVGGSVAMSEDLLLEPARKTVPNRSFQSVSPQVRIVTTEHSDDSSILGCSWLARQASSQS
jgi:glucokinase